MPCAKLVHPKKGYHPFGCNKPGEASNFELQTGLPVVFAVGVDVLVPFKYASLDYFPIEWWRTASIEVVLAGHACCSCTMKKGQLLENVKGRAGAGDSAQQQQAPWRNTFNGECCMATRLVLCTSCHGGHVQI